MNIYLIRHGETDWNKDKKIQGREDIELNQNGIMQAEKCGQAFKNIKIDKVVASPLKRARKTAEIIASYVNVNEVFIENNLIERDYGNLSGFTMSEMDKCRRCGYDESVEKWEVLSSRIKNVIDNYRIKENVDNIIMVSHGAAINSLLALLTDHKIGTGKTPLKNACISILECDSEKINIADYNLSSEEFVNIG